MQAPVANELDDIVSFLADSRAIADKIAIKSAYAPALETLVDDARIGDDCAAIPDGSGGYLLFAVEGLLQRFVVDDPWFAGYSAVMVNLSDVAAMGGRSLAIADVIWTPDLDESTAVWDGMQAAAEAYRIPVVGGHTTLTREPGPVYLATAVLGKATHLLSSVDAQPGDELLMAVDLNGSYRGDKPFWNASTGATAEHVRAIMELLPEIAERGWCRSAKDISNGGIVGTIVMLLECYEVGASIDLATLPRPQDVDLEKWLLSFPSFGYLLSVAPANSEQVIRHFASQDIACKVVGEITRAARLELRLDGQSRVFWEASSNRADA